MTSHETAQAQGNKPPCRVCTDFKSWIKTQRQTEGKKEDAASTSNVETNKKVVEAKGSDHSICPLDRDSLGRNTWSLLHTIAAWYPNQPTTQNQQHTTHFINNLAHVYPCDYCAQHMRKDLIDEPPDVSSQQNLSQWMCRLHNKVNAKLGKEIFECNQVNERWRDGWKDGRCDKY